MLQWRRRGVKGASMRIQEALSNWPDIEIGPHRYGGIEYRLHHSEIGHTHGDRQADIKFSRAIREKLVEAGRANPHHIHPETGWISFYIREEEDVDKAVELFRLAYDHIKARKAPRNLQQPA